jgi:hypothetical protein
LDGQRERLKDLYFLGDVTKDEYTYKRQILERELAALEPPVVNEAEEAAAALTNFAPSGSESKMRRRETARRARTAARDARPRPVLRRGRQRTRRT